MSTIIVFGPESPTSETGHGAAINREERLVVSQDPDDARQVLETYAERRQLAPFEAFVAPQKMTSVWVNPALVRYIRGG